MNNLDKSSFFLEYNKFLVVQNLVFIFIKLICIHFSRQPTSDVSFAFKYQQFYLFIYLNFCKTQSMNY